MTIFHQMAHLLFLLALGLTFFHQVVQPGSSYCVREVLGWVGYGWAYLRFNEATSLLSVPDDVIPRRCDNLSGGYNEPFPHRLGLIAYHHHRWCIGAYDGQTSTDEPFFKLEERGKTILGIAFFALLALATVPFLPRVFKNLVRLSTSFLRLLFLAVAFVVTKPVGADQKEDGFGTRLFLFSIDLITRLIILATHLLISLLSLAVAFVVTKPVGAGQKEDGKDGIPPTDVATQVILLPFSAPLLSSPSSSTTLKDSSKLHTECQQKAERLARQIRLEARLKSEWVNECRHRENKIAWLEGRLVEEVATSKEAAARAEKPLLAKINELSDAVVAEQQKVKGGQALLSQLAVEKGKAEAALNAKLEAALLEKSQLQKQVTIHNVVSKAYAASNVVIIRLEGEKKQLEAELAMLQAREERSKEDRRDFPPDLAAPAKEDDEMDME